MYLRPLRSGANVLFRHPPYVPSAERAAPGAALNGLGERTSPRSLTFLPLPVEERNGAKGKVRGHHPPFRSRSAGEEGVGGKVRATRRAPQHWPCNRCTPVPARRGAAYGTRHRSSDHDSDVMVKSYQKPKFLIML